MISLNVREAVLYSLDFNKEKSLISKPFLATGAVALSLFSLYRIDLSDVSARVKVEKGYDRSDLVLSLKKTKDSNRHTLYKFA